jgi:hypothetical protein
MLRRDPATWPSTTANRLKDVVIPPKERGPIASDLAFGMDPPLRLTTPWRCVLATWRPVAGSLVLVSGYHCAPSEFPPLSSPLPPPATANVLRL